MDRQPPSLDEIVKPDLLRARIDQHDQRIWELLRRLDTLEQAHPAVAAAGLTAEERRLLAQLQIGSTSNSAPAANALIPNVTSLPPVAQGVDGQTVRLTTDGLVYRFDGTTQTWLPFTVSSHNLLSATHPDTLPAAPVLGDLPHANGTPLWARLAGQVTNVRKYLSQTGTGATSAVPAWLDAMTLDTVQSVLAGAIKTFLDTVHIAIAGPTTTPFLQLDDSFGGYAAYFVIEEEITLSLVALTTLSAGLLLPPNSIILGVTARVTTGVTGPTTGLQIGDSTTATRFKGTVANLGIAAGSTATGTDQMSGAAGTLATGPTQPAADNIKITAAGGIPTAGKVRVVVYAIQMVAPSS